MSIYHCSIKNISRSSGRSAVACAAYRSGEELEDLETGITHDYRKKTGIAFAEIFLCKNAPERFQNREELWNEVEKSRKQRTRDWLAKSRWQSRGNYRLKR